MKLAIVVPTLMCGGAERVVVTLAKELSSRDVHITIITLSGIDTDFYKLPSEIHRVALDVLGRSDGAIASLKNNIQRIVQLRKALIASTPDIVVSHLTETNILTVLASFGGKVSVVLNEHCDPNTSVCGKPWRMLRRLTYPMAGMLVCVSKGVSESFPWLSTNKRMVIYNPFFADSETSGQLLSPQMDQSRPWVLSMGRLTHQKGFDLLIDSFSSIAAEFPDWQLIIIGDGELRGELEAQIKNLKLEGTVILPGRFENPFEILRKAEFFVMASRYEGFPMAHGEAMLCGLPVVSTDCPSGPSELIRHNIDGLLVANGSEKELIESMRLLISEPETRKKYSKAALEINKRFSIDNIMNEWLELCDKLSPTTGK